MKLTPLLPIALSLVSLCACTPQPVDNGNGSSSSATSSQTSVLPTQDTKEAAATDIVAALKSNNFAKLSMYVHPTKGVRFTPYTNVDSENNLSLRAEDIAAADSDATKHTWGFTEGSGEPIEKSITEYFARYVYNHDYASAPVVRWNQKAEYGSVIDNAADMYPDAEIVEYHFNGFDPKYEGMDWASLRLVLEESDGHWYLVGVIHDEWAP